MRNHLFFTVQRASRAKMLFFIRKSSRPFTQTPNLKHALLKQCTSSGCHIFILPTRRVTVALLLFPQSDTAGEFGHVAGSCEAEWTWFHFVFNFSKISQILIANLISVNLDIEEHTADDPRTVLFLSLARQHVHRPSINEGTPMPRREFLCKITYPFEV